MSLRPSPETDSDDIIWFHSEIDWWLGAFLVIIPFILAGAFLWALISLGGRNAIAAGIGCVVVGAIYGLLIFPMRYGFSSEALVIRFGIVRQRIMYKSIHEVYPTHSPLSSPALSLRRLAIKTGTKAIETTLVSPQRREEFLTLLASKTGMDRDGDRLTR